MRRLAPPLNRLLSAGRARKRAMVLALDIAVCVICAFAAFSLRVGALAFPLYPFLIFVAVAVALFIPLFYFNRVYATIFRFSGIGTIADIIRAMVPYTAAMVLVFSINTVPGVPRTVALIHSILFLGMTSISRIAIRHLLSELANVNRRRAGRRALIYGAGQAGMQLALSLRHVPEIAVIGFIDDDPRLAGHRLESGRVYHPDELGRLVERDDVSLVLLAMPSASRRTRAEIIRRLEPLSLEVKTLPPVESIVDGRVSVDDLQAVQVDDLLGREVVAPDVALLDRAIRDKVVMVTGAGGSIGSELCRQIVRSQPRQLVLVEMTEHALYEIDGELRELCKASDTPVLIEPELMSLTSQAATERLFSRWKPQTVFHAAAYKHVPLVERNAISGLRNNVMGTLNAARSARDAGAERFILVSTDKAVRPTNVMGASKRVCELILQNLSAQSPGTLFAMVRFGNVLGSSGSVVPRFLRQIREGGPVTVTHAEVTRYFMAIPEAAQLVIQAGAMARGGEVYLLDMGESVRIYDLAAQMIRLSGLTVRDREHPDGEVEIVEVGLRPGEKLYEELLIDAEAEITDHPRIRRAREQMLDQPTLDALLSQLFAALDAGDRTAAIAALRELVPEYSGAAIAA